MTALHIVGIVFGGLFVMILAYLATVIFTPIVREPKQALPDMGETRSPSCPPGIRQDVHFGDKGDERAGWLYLPLSAKEPVPCVVMNNGFGGTKDIILEPFALRFVEAGLAVLTYDYRHFGESAGTPRNHYSIDSQIKDCIFVIRIPFRRIHCFSIKVRVTARLGLGRR